VKQPTLRPGHVYAITINPSDDYQYYKLNSPLEQMWKKRLGEFKKYWSALLVNMFSRFDIEYNLNIEISEPLDGNDASPRLHFHGIIKFTTEDAIMEFLLILLDKLKMRSRIKIKPIDNMKKWHDYCMKQTFLPLGNIDYRLKWDETEEEEEIDIEERRAQAIIPTSSEKGCRIREPKEPKQGGKGSRARALPSRRTKKTA